MRNSSIKPILVTGSQRSGSTWVGEMINFSSKINLYTEPFNPLNTWYGLEDIVKEWFHFVTEEEGQKYFKEMKHALGLGYNFSDLLKNIENNSSVRGKLGAIRRYFLYPLEKTMGNRPLIKDPLAFFSSEWIYKQFQADVIMLIRHPAAFVSSIKRMNMNTPGWGLDFFPDLLKQKDLMDKYLQPYKNELVRLSSGKVDVIDGSILLWNIFHDTIHIFQDKYADKWMFFRHKDLSEDPINMFEGIYKKLDLPYTEKIKQKIAESTSEKNPTEAINNALHTLNRNSKANVFNWKHRLSVEEIERIYEGTRVVASKFYLEEDWK